MPIEFKVTDETGEVIAVRWSPPIPGGPSWITLERTYTYGKGSEVVTASELIQVAPTLVKRLVAVLNSYLDG